MTKSELQYRATVRRIEGLGYRVTPGYCLAGPTVDVDKVDKPNIIECWECVMSGRWSDYERALRRAFRRYQEREKEQVGIVG